jgi:hypothetical protein
MRVQAVLMISLLFSLGSCDRLATENINPALDNPISLKRFGNLNITKLTQVRK